MGPRRGRGGGLGRVRSPRAPCCPHRRSACAGAARPTLLPADSHLGSLNTLASGPCTLCSLGTNAVPHTPLSSPRACSLAAACAAGSGDSGVLAPKLLQSRCRSSPGATPPVGTERPEREGLAQPAGPGDSRGPGCAPATPAPPRPCGLFRRVCADTVRPLRVPQTRGPARCAPSSEAARLCACESGRRQHPQPPGSRAESKRECWRVSPVTPPQSHCASTGHTCP